MVTNPTVRPGLRQPSLGRNVISNWAALAFGILVSFFLSPFVVRHLGSTGYGVWVLIVSLTSYLQFVDLGVRNAVTRFISKFHAQGDDQSASRILSTALVFFGLAGLLAVIAGAMATLFAIRLFNIPGIYQRQVKIALFLAGANVAAWLIKGAFAGCLAGLQRFEAMNAIEVALGAARAVGVVLTLKFGGGLVGLALVELAYSVAGCLAQLSLSFRIYPHLRIRLGLFTRRHLAMILSFSVFSFLLDIALELIYYTDVLIIGVFLPIGEMAFFSIAANPRNYSRSLVAGLANAMTPAASKLEAQTRHDDLKGFLRVGARNASLIMLPIAVTFILRGRTFIDLWMGGEYGELCGHVLRILFLAVLFNAACQVAQSVVLGIGKHKAVVPVLLAQGICNLVLAFALVRSKGIVGVAWATTIPSLATSVLFWPWFMRRTLGFPIRDFVMSAWVRPGVAVLPFALCTYAFEQLLPPPNLIIFFLQVGVAVPLAFFGAWVFCLDRHECESCVRKAREILALVYERV
jgi:O-antigen/teichoic acid export membrane protein